MGDKLRNQLGFSNNWSKDDEKEYFRLRKKELGPIYMTENIPLESPWERIRYLDGKLCVGDGLDEGVILKIAKERGNAPALVALEEKAINEYF